MGCSASTQSVAILPAKHHDTSAAPKPINNIIYELYPSKNINDILKEKEKEKDVNNQHSSQPQLVLHPSKHHSHSSSSDGDVASSFPVPSTTRPISSSASVTGIGIVPSGTSSLRPAMSSSSAFPPSSAASTRPTTNSSSAFPLPPSSNSTRPVTSIARFDRKPSISVNVNVNAISEDAVPIVPLPVSKAPQPNVDIIHHEDGTTSEEVVPIRDALEYAEVYHMYQENNPEYREYKALWEREQIRESEERAAGRRSSRSIYSPTHSQQRPEISTPCSPVPGPYVDDRTCFAFLASSRPGSLCPSPIPGFHIYTPTGSQPASTTPGPVFNFSLPCSPLGPRANSEMKHKDRGSPLSPRADASPRPRAASLLTHHRANSAMQSFQSMQHVDSPAQQPFQPPPLPAPTAPQQQAAAAAGAPLSPRTHRRNPSEAVQPTASSSVYTHPRGALDWLKIESRLHRLAEQEEDEDEDKPAVVVSREEDASADSPTNRLQPSDSPIQSHPSVESPLQPRSRPAVDSPLQPHPPVDSPSQAAPRPLSARRVLLDPSTRQVVKKDEKEKEKEKDNWTPCYTNANSVDRTPLSASRPSVVLRSLRISGSGAAPSPISPSGASNKLIGLIQLPNINAQHTPTQSSTRQLINDRMQSQPSAPAQPLVTTTSTSIRIKKMVPTTELNTVQVATKVM